MSYIPVHQVWKYVQYKPKPEASAITTEIEKTKPVDKTRHIVQIQRIKKRIDIFTLAKLAGTTPKALTLYEKGEDILSKEILEELFKILEIEIKRT